MTLYLLVEAIQLIDGNILILGNKEREFIANRTRAGGFDHTPSFLLSSFASLVLLHFPR